MYAGWRLGESMPGKGDRGKSFWEKLGKRRLVTVTVSMATVFVVVELLLFFGVDYNNNTVGNMLRCAKTVPAISNIAKNPATLEMGGGQDPTIHMGRALGTRTKIVNFKLATAKAGSKPLGDGPLVTEVLTFERKDGAAQLDECDLSASAVKVRDQVHLWVTVQRPTAVTAKPGIYAGTVRIIDPRVAPADVVMTVELADPRYTIIAAWALIFCAAAAVWVWFLRYYSPLGIDPKEARANKSVFLWVVTVAAGLSAAALAWTTTYLNNPNWGSDEAQWLTLGGVCFTAFTTAASVPAVWPTAKKADCEGRPAPPTGQNPEPAGASRVPER